MARGQYLATMKDTKTGAVYDCTDYLGGALQEISSPIIWSNSSFESQDRPGGVKLKNSKLGMRTYTATLRKRYGGSILTFQAAWDEFVNKLGRGNEILFEFRQQDGSSRYQEGFINEADENNAVDNGTWFAIPFKFTCPDPLRHSLNKPGVLLANTGLQADTGLFADGDPDAFTLTAAATYLPYVITNTLSTHPDWGPKVILKGPLTGPIYAYNYSLPFINGQPQYVVYIGNVALGETVTIDTGAGDVTSDKAGVDAYALFGYGVGQDYWWGVEQGTNNIKLYAAGYGAGHKIIIDYLARFG